MKVETTFVDGVQIGQRHRSLNREKVAALAESMKEIGLQTPISVWAPDDDTHLLVTGLHRLEAARQLGWDTIPVVYVAMDEVEREMWEISENLHRVGLTKEERDEHIRRYAELLKKRRVSRQHDAKLSPQISPLGTGRPRGVAREIAEETGMSQRTIQRALSPSSPIVNVLSDEELDHKDFEKLVRLWNSVRPGAKDLFVDFIT